MNYLQEQHHCSLDTYHNRYPKIFASCKKYILTSISNKIPNILSFGCSRGEECFTLAEYFPNSTIVGADINTDVLVICNNMNKNPNISFIYSNCENIRQKGNYDIIFCMSVLIKWVGYKFSQFDNTVIELDNVLNKDGLLVIYNSIFRFSDSSIYHKYRVLYDPEIVESGFIKKFDKNNNILQSQYKDCIFIKIKD